MRIQSFFWNQLDLSDMLSSEERFCIDPEKALQHSILEESSWVPFLYEETQTNKSSFKEYKSFSNFCFSNFFFSNFCFFLFRRFSSVKHWLVLNKSWNASHIFPNPQSTKNIYCPQGSTDRKIIQTVWGDQVTKNRNMTIFLQRTYTVKTNTR